MITTQPHNRECLCELIMMHQSKKISAYKPCIHSISIIYTFVDTNMILNYKTIYSMDTCEGPCLYHCTTTTENTKYLIIGICVGLFLGYILFRNAKHLTIKHDETHDETHDDKTSDDKT